MSQDSTTTNTFHGEPEPANDTGLDLLTKALLVITGVTILALVVALGFQLASLFL